MQFLTVADSNTNLRIQAQIIRSNLIADHLTN